MFPEDRPFEIVAPEPADAAPCRQRLGVEYDWSSRTDRRILFVPPAVGIRRRHLDRWNGDESGQGRWRGETELAFPASPGNRECSTSRKKRHIGAEPSGEVQELVSWDRVACERVHGVQCRGAVARAATESGANGDMLSQPDRYSEAVARRVENRARRVHRKVLIVRSEIGSVDLQLYACISPANLQLVGELEQRERRLDLMKS